MQRNPPVSTRRAVIPGRMWRRTFSLNPFKRFEDMRFLMRCKDVETIEVNPIIFRKLTREDWLHIVNICDKSLEKYYLRIKK